MTDHAFVPGTPVVVPFDATDASAHAIGPARDLAALLGGGVTVVNAVEDAHQIDARRAEIEAHPALRELGPDARVVVVADPFAVGAITADPAAVVCMATSASPLHVDRYLGSMAEKVVRTGGRPTVLVGPECRSTGGFDVDRLVVPVDETDASRRAIHAARGLGDLLEADVETVTVVPASEASHPDADVMLPAGDVAGSLVDHAGDTAVIVMATRARRGLTRLFGGSTTAEVVRSSTRPVVVVDGRPDREADDR